MRIVIVMGNVLRLPGHYYASQPEPEAEGMLKTLWKLLKYANCIMVTKKIKNCTPEARGAGVQAEKKKRTNRTAFHILCFIMCFVYNLTLTVPV